MDKENLEKIKEIIIQIGPKEYKARIKEIQGLTQITATPVPPIQDIWMKKKANICFSANNTNYSFPATVYLPEHNRMIIIRSGDITLNKRTQKRVETDIISSTITVKSMFGLLGKEVDAKIVDLTDTGAQIWTKEPLDMDKEYILSFEFKHNKLSIPFNVKREIDHRDETFVYGLYFVKVSDADQKVINKYLSKTKDVQEEKWEVLPRVPQETSLENINKLWEAFSEEGK